MGGVGEAGAAAPAEADRGVLAGGGGEGRGVVADGVEPAGLVGGSQLADGGADVVAERFGAAAVGAEAAEKVGGDGDEALGGQLVGDATDPVGHAEDLVDDDHDRGLVGPLGVDDPGVQLDVGTGERHVDPFAVARGGGQRLGGYAVVAGGRQRDGPGRRAGGGGEHRDEERDQPRFAHVPIVVAASVHGNRADRRAGGAGGMALRLRWPTGCASAAHAGRRRAAMAQLTPAAIAPIQPAICSVDVASKRPRRAASSSWRGAA